MRDHARADRLPPRLPLRARELPQPLLKLIGRPVRPPAAEIATNPRARSAVMRIAEKLPAAARAAC
jgi:16S rRNA (cytosine1402-N4)-methyltransferase